MKPSPKHLSYRDLSREDLRKTFQPRILCTEILSGIIPLEPAAWLKQILQEGFEVSVFRDKTRSEFIILPILLFIREVHQGKIRIDSGTHFDVEP